MRNQGITDKPVPPWELSGAVRRDCEPHRGELLGRLSLVTSWLAAAGALLVIPGLLALALAVAVRVMARHDLALMRLGGMDPAGEDDTRQAGVESIFAALVLLVVWATLALVICCILCPADF
jgi:hypothetical protein